MPSMNSVSQAIPWYITFIVSWAVNVIFLSVSQPLRSSCNIFAVRNNAGNKISEDN